MGKLCPQPTRRRPLAQRDAIARKTSSEQDEEAPPSVVAVTGNTVANEKVEADSDVEAVSKLFRINLEFIGNWIASLSSVAKHVETYRGLFKPRGCFII